MARIRSVHPGFWTDEAFVSVSPLARLLAIGIWNECDDQGAFAWKPVTLKMRILPADNADVAALLAELEAADLLRRYEAGGKELGAVRNFAKFQRPKKPHYTHPMPDTMRVYAGHDAAGSEPDDDETPSGAPPPKANGAAVSHQFPTASPPIPQKGEIAPQMKETLRSQEVRKSPPVRPPAAAPPEPNPASASRAGRNARRPIPSDWEPDEAAQAVAAGLGLDCSWEAAEFRSFWLGDGGRKQNWQQAFISRCHNRAEYLEKRAKPRPRRESASEERKRVLNLPSSIDRMRVLGMLQ